MSNDPLSQEIGSGDRPRRQDTTLGGADAQTRPETAFKMSRDQPFLKVSTSGREEDIMKYHDDLTDFVPPTPHDSPLSGGNTPGSDEGRMELIQELMETYTSLTKRVLALEEAKTAQDRSETSLGRRARIKTDEVIVEDKGSGEKCGSTSRSSLVLAKARISTAMVSCESKEKEKGVVLIDEEEPPRLNRSTTTLQPLPTIDPKDKGKGVLVEEEPEKPVKVKRRDQGLAQIESDAELAQRLHEEELAELDRAQKERQKQEEATSAALAEEFDEIQARIDADHELAIRLTHEEQEKYTIKERARLLAEFFERRKKQLAAERAEAIRNKPPTRTQVRNMMITYLKHIREKKWIDDFKPIDDDSQQQAESTKKRPRADSEEESSKKQKLEEDNDAEKEELRDSMV
ncbi:hypothetical protein Tco_1044081 [Tanacetum coccineum]|uniref:Uncharacterized protein n=1 Tax=Tanacetum coccineum TaxID=301880 RepID=A0ABQ5GNY2_9ASTR